MTGRLLAASSLLTLAAGVGAGPAFACVAAGSPGFTNPVHATVSCVTVTNTSFTGDINNNGVIKPDGISFENGTITGSIFAVGNILSASPHPGIGLDANSLIRGTVAGIAIDGSTQTFTGGISNHGKISASSFGIIVQAPTFGGGITNSGTVAALETVKAGTANGIAIAIRSVSTFGGGVTNDGTISGQDGIIVKGFTKGIGTFTDGIANSGMITAGKSGAGILLTGFERFSGGISNKGTISAGAAGIDVAIPTFSGGIANTGGVTSTKSSGIVVGNTAGVTSFSGGISNAAGATISAGRTGILVNFVENYSGGLSNSGVINAGVGRTGINVDVGLTFSGGITNDGTISGGAKGVNVQTIDLFYGDIVNNTTISGNNVGLAVNGVSTFTGDIVNAGRIAGGQTGVLIANLGYSSGSISNIGTITGAKGIVVTGGDLNNGTIDNYGTIIGTSGTAIDLSHSAIKMYVEIHDGSTINGTILFSPNGDLLYGAGTILGGLNSGNATIWPRLVGSGTISLANSYTQTAAGTLMVDVNPTKASQLAVGGGASLNGTLSIEYDPGVYKTNTYVLLTTVGGITGNFTKVIGTPPDGITEKIVNTGTEIELLLTGSGTLGFFGATPGGTSIVGASLNQQNVANSINNFVFNGGTLPAGFAALAARSGGAVLQGLDQLSGEVGPSFIAGGFAAGRLFLGLITNPFNFDRGGGFGPAQAFAAEEPVRSPLPDDIALAYASILGDADGKAATFASRWRSWFAAYGGSGSIAGDPVVGSHTTSSQLFGFAGGLDYHVTPDTVVGLALAGGDVGWSLTAGMGNGNSNMFQAGVYASNRWGPIYVTGALADSLHGVTTNRSVSISGIDTLTAAFVANVVSARLEGGYRFGIGGFGVTPYAAIQPQWMQLPAYSETASIGSPQFALNYAAQNPLDLRTELGAWFDDSILLNQGSRLQVYARTAWANDSGSSPGATAFFQTLPGASFLVNSARPDNNSALVSAGAKYALADGWSVMATFDGEFSGNTSIFAGSGILRKTW